MQPGETLDTTIHEPAAEKRELVDIRRCRAALARLYPGLARPATSRFDLDRLLEDREEANGGFMQLMPGDIVFDASDTETAIGCRKREGYAIELPPREYLNSIIEDFSSDNASVGPVTKLFRYAFFINRKMPYAKWPSDISFETFIAAYSAAMDGRISTLKDVIDQKLPAVCFSQALALAFVAQNDPEIRDSGIKVAFSTGIAKRAGSGGGHAWVTAMFPQEMVEREGLDSQSYIIDPTQLKIASADATVLFYGTEYIELGPKETYKGILHDKRLSNNCGVLRLRDKNYV